MSVNILKTDNKTKRRLATSKECQVDLNEQLPIMFKAFTEAVRMYETEIIQTPPQSRARAFEASLLNSKMIQSIQSNFPVNWKFGKYKRFILNVQGYTILFKKLNSKDKPMNISTDHTSAILNQYQTSLFWNTTFSINPILFFGYKKDRLGNIYDPKLVYIDEDKVQWTLTENVVQNNNDIKHLSRVSVEKAIPKLKETLKEIKKTSNQ